MIHEAPFKKIRARGRRSISYFHINRVKTESKSNQKFGRSMAHGASDGAIHAYVGSGVSSGIWSNYVQGMPHLCVCVALWEE